MTEQEAVAQMVDLIRDIVDDKVNTHSDYTSAEISAELIRLHPAVVDAWVLSQREGLLRGWVSGLLGRWRRSVQRTVKLKSAISLQKEGSSLMAVGYIINDQNARRQLGDMTSEDHLYVADQYQKRWNENRMRDALHRNLARSLAPGQVTSDVWTEEQLRKLFDELGGAE